MSQLHNILRGIITMVIAMPFISYSQAVEPAPSGAIPVIYINTQDNAPIVSKEEYIPATFYIDPCEMNKFEAVGSIDNQIKLEIRGRGNSTWLRPKKPYKIKLDKKTSLFGLPKNKHWALLSLDWEKISNFSALEYGRILELGWQPHMQPVELVLNGKYEGIYYLTETIRIDSGRLDIFEQKDGETDTEIIPYGWLVEIDNYLDEFQITVPENDNNILMVTHHTPEVLSDPQREWLTKEFTEINAAIYTPDKFDNSWEERIDAMSMAKVFVIHELFDNIDGFLGSFYLHKDKDDSLWHCGPLWDINGQTRERINFTANSLGWNEQEFTPRWIRELLKFPHFVELVRKVWSEYISEDFSFINSRIDEFITNIDKCDSANNERWKDAQTPCSTPNLAKYWKSWFNKSYAFLNPLITDKVSSLELSSSKIQVYQEEQKEIGVTTTPALCFDPIVWKSEDNNIAMVKDGVVTGIEPGETTITAYCGEFKVSCAVKVNEGSFVNDAYNSEISLKVVGDELVISGKPEDMEAALYDIAGRTVYIGTNSSIKIPAHGIYILHVDCKSYPILM